MTEFKANCAALLEEVGASGETITVTKRGRALATVTPPVRRERKKKFRSSEGALAGKLFIPDDLLMSNAADRLKMDRNPDWALKLEKRPTR